MQSHVTPPSVLVLGGTRFVGRAVVEDALGRGYQVTMFNRGLTGPDLFPSAETVIGDRTADLSALAGRRFDAVVDVAGYDPEVVRRSVDALRGSVGRYVFVSTASVYRDHGITQVEGNELLPLTAETAGDDLYGARKAACEEIVAEAFGDRSTFARSGMIVGPHDPTDRFAYWPRRLAHGGPVLAPGAPADPVQFVDVRDLAGWLVDACINDLCGAYNISGVPLPFGEFLGVCGHADLVWAPTEWLLGQDVDPWMGVPMWIAAPGWEAANDLDVSRALAAGLRLRPVADTVRDTVAWDQARGGPAPDADGLPAVREAALLAALRVS